MTDNRSCVIYALSTMPTKASMLGTCLRASQARSAVGATWFLKTPASPASRAGVRSCAVSLRCRPCVAGAGGRA